MKTEIKKDVLIAIMNKKKDFGILHNQHWYRIPVDKAPLIVRNGTLKYIAFYQTKIFEDEAYSIRWMGNVKDIKKVKRFELLPDESKNPKSEKEYYKIEIQNLKKIERPIISQRPRRVAFVSTSYEHFSKSIEYNDVFLESPIEEIIWKKLKDENISAERQYLINVKEEWFILDFALFTKIKPIDVECDGDEYHLEEDDVKYDKDRNNMLESEGWSVLRYTTEKILQGLDGVLEQIKDTINRNGGLEDLDNEKNYRFFTNSKGQTEIF